MLTWDKHVSEVIKIIKKLSITDISGKEIEIDEGFNIIIEKIIILKRSKNNLFIVGNGASASMSSHFSADLAKNGKIRTNVFTDLSLVTAMGNDEGYENIFLEPLKIWADKNDCLFTISSSGNSKNIINAINEAREIGLFCITLSAMNIDNISRNNGDINIYIPANEYGNAEVIHAMILHYLTDIILKAM